MTYATLSTLGLLLVFGPMTVLVQRSTPPEALGVAECADSASSFACGFVAFVRQVVTNPEFAANRESLYLARVPASELVLVTDNALCVRIGKALEREFKQPTAARIFAVRVGAAIWAEDSTITAGEFGAGIVFDSALTKVLSRSLR